MLTWLMAVLVVVPPLLAASPVPFVPTAEKTETVLATLMRHTEPHFYFGDVAPFGAVAADSTHVYYPGQNAPVEGPQFGTGEPGLLWQPSVIKVARSLTGGTTERVLADQQKVWVKVGKYTLPDEGRFDLVRVKVHALFKDPNNPRLLVLLSNMNAYMVNTDTMTVTTTVADFLVHGIGTIRDRLAEDFMSFQFEGKWLIGATVDWSGGILNMMFTERGEDLYWSGAGCTGESEFKFYHYAMRLDGSGVSSQIGDASSSRYDFYEARAATMLGNDVIVRNNEALGRFKNAAGNFEKLLSLTTIAEDQYVYMLPHPSEQAVYVAVEYGTIFKMAIGATDATTVAHGAVPDLRSLVMDPIGYLYVGGTGTISKLRMDTLDIVGVVALPGGPLSAGHRVSGMFYDGFHLFTYSQGPFEKIGFFDDPPEGCPALDEQVNTGRCCPWNIYGFRTCRPAALVRWEVSDCESFATCGECVAPSGIADDRSLYCGWCFETSSCTRQSVCPTGAWIDNTCPVLTSVTPEAVSSNGALVTLSTAPALLPASKTFECRLGEGAIIVPAVRQSAGVVTCNLPSGSAISDDITLFSDGLPFVPNSLPFVRYSCASADTCAGCGFLELCSWCFNTSSCQGTGTCPASTAARIEDCTDLAAVVPNAVAVDGNAPVTIYGRGFAPEVQYSCVFGGTDVAAVQIDNTSLACTAPPSLSVAGVTLTVHAWGKALLIQPLQFVYFDCTVFSTCDRCAGSGQCGWCYENNMCMGTGTCPPGTPVASSLVECSKVDAVAPNSGPTIGGVPTTITGSNFYSLQQYYCVFGLTAVAATHRSPTSLECVSPRSSVTGIHVVRVQSGGSGAAGSAPYNYYTCSGTTCEACVSDSKPMCGLCYGDGSKGAQCTIAAECNATFVRSCTVCSPGQAYDIGLQACVDCPENTMSLASVCVDCPPGRFSGGNATECRVCPVGTSSPGERAGCTPCEGTTVAATPGQSACVDCRDFVNTYALNGRKCEECDDGADCSTGARLPEVGHWYDSTTDEFVLCSGAFACPGGQQAMVSPCSTGYSKESYACSKCEDRYALSNGVCSKCWSKGLNWVLIIGVFVGLSALIAAFVYSTMSLKTSSPASSLQKIILNHCQTVALVLEVAVVSRSRVAGVLAFTSVSTGSVLHLFPISCEVPLSFFDKILVYFVVPKVAALLCILGLVVALVARGGGVASFIGDSATKVVFTVILVANFLFFPTIVKEMLSVFNCRTYGGSVLRLQGDLDVLCYEGEHNSYVGLAIVDLFISIVVFAGGSCAILVAKRKQLGTLEVRRFFKFMYDGYRRDTFYWEFMLIARKVSLVAVTVFARTETTQLGLVGLTLLASFLVHLLFKPYTTRAANTCENISLSVVLFTVMAMAIVADPLIDPALLHTITVACLAMHAVAIAAMIVAWAVLMSRHQLNDKLVDKHLHGWVEEHQAIPVVTFSEAAVLELKSVAYAPPDTTSQTGAGSDNESRPTPPPAAAADDDAPERPTRAPPAPASDDNDSPGGRPARAPPAPASDDNGPAGGRPARPPPAPDSDDEC